MWNVSALSRWLKAWSSPSSTEISSGLPPACSTAFHGSVSSTCSTPSAARKAIVLPCSSVAMGRGFTQALRPFHRPRAVGSRSCMGYVIAALLVVLIVGGFVFFLVGNATKKSNVSDAGDPGADQNSLSIVGSDDETAAGDTNQLSDNNGEEG